MNRHFLKINFSKLLILSVGLFLLLPILALAQMEHAPDLTPPGELPAWAQPRTQKVDSDFIPQVTIPGGIITAGEKMKVDKTGSLIASYIIAIYRYGIWLAGGLAVIMIMVGGLMWLLAGGSPARVSSAKERIGAAILGLGLALASYLILAGINPKLVQLGLKPAAGPEVALAPTGPVELAMNEGETKEVDIGGAHNLTINWVRDDETSITLASQPVTFTLKKGQSQALDTDANGIPDLLIMVLDIVGKRVLLRLEIIPWSTVNYGLGAYRELDHVACDPESGDAYWYDTNNKKGVLYADCQPDQNCEFGQCGGQAAPAPGCTPQCAGRQCGDDGCGQGNECPPGCQSGQQCQDGRCVNCQPDRQECIGDNLYDVDTCSRRSFNTICSRASQSGPCGRDYCDGDTLYHDCTNTLGRGCQTDHCTTETVTNKVSVTNCQYGCDPAAGACKPAPTCTDNDQDGYGVCPNCGIVSACTFDSEDCDDTNAGIYPGTQRDCDTRRPGICQAGRQTLQADCQWGNCQQVSPSQTEICNNGTDDDCDSLSDGADPDCFECQPSATRSCQTGQSGICAAGTQTCVAGFWGACSRNQNPTREVCDGLDNDCNSTTADGAAEVWYNQTTSCGLGACAATGRNICQSGQQVNTCASRQPVAEVCNDGQDNDCDGPTDCADPNCPAGSVCQTGFCCGGSCASTGSLRCTDGSCNIYNEACCAAGNLERALQCSGVSLVCSGGAGTCSQSCGAAPQCNGDLINSCGDGSGQCIALCQYTSCGITSCASDVCTGATYNDYPQTASVTRGSCQNSCSGNSCQSCSATTGSCQPQSQTCAAVLSCQDATSNCGGGVLEKCHRSNAGDWQWDTSLGTETACSDGADNDCDNLTDCADSDCAATCCGNGTCNKGLNNIGGECATCTKDCQPSQCCGNNACETSDSNCPADVISCPATLDTICQEPVCQGGCKQMPVEDYGTDEDCHDDAGCVGGNCHCNGTGQCIKYDKCPPTLPAGMLFCDDFESGNLNKWKTPVTLGVEIVQSGSKAAQVDYSPSSEQMDPNQSRAQLLETKKLANAPTAEMYVKFNLQFSSTFHFDTFFIRYFNAVDSNPWTISLVQWTNRYLNDNKFKLDFEAFNMTGGSRSDFATDEIWDAIIGQPLTKNDWHTFEIYIRYNDSGRQNGIYKLWIDQVLVSERTNAVFRDNSTPNSIYDTLRIPTTGGDPANLPRPGDFVLVDNVQIWNKLPDGAGGGTTPPTPPPAVGNVKNSAQYSANEAFIISDENWQDVLSLVPLTTWSEGTTVKKYPTLIYHREGNNFDADSLIHFLQLYNPGKVTTIGSPPTGLSNLLTAAKPTGAGILSGNIVNKPLVNNYFFYWSSYGEVVYVENNYRLALLAATYASLKNVPLIVQGSSLDVAGVFNGKTVIRVGAIPTCPAGATCQVNNTFDTNSDGQYQLNELEKKYAIETNTDKVILVNADDLNIARDDTSEWGAAGFYFNPRKGGGTIHKYFASNSLAAPFLAAGKKELLISTTVAGSPENTECTNIPEVRTNINTVDADLESRLPALFSVSPNYLTIIASPNAIPDSYYSRCSGWQYRTPVDWQYGSYNDTGVLMRTGRIFGVTITDTASYVVRSLFYDDLFNKIYQPNQYTGLVTFGREAGCSGNIQWQTARSGYTTDCVCDAGTNAACTTLSSWNHIDSNRLKNKQFITFTDHGDVSSWDSVLNYNEIESLDLPFTVSVACLTGNFWQGSWSTMSVNFIRRGAMAYLGTLGSLDSRANVDQKTMERLTGAVRVTLGEMYKQLFEQYEGPNPTGWGTDAGRYVIKQYYQLLGDPTLTLKFKQVTW